MIKKIISLILILSISCFLFSCGKTDVTETTEKDDYILPTEIIHSDISLPYMSSDSFEPYKAKSSINRDIIPVIYESLYFASNSGKGEACLASEGSISGKNVNIKLKTNVKFSDGSVLTSKDVKESFIKAKSNAHYKNNLENFLDVKIIDNNNLQFSLINQDFFALNCLTFPVVKNKGDSLIGTGKYYLEYLDNRPYLQLNVQHRDFSKSWNKQIALFDMAGVTSPIYPFKSNKISVYKNDLRNGSYINLSSKTVSQSLNNFVYLGVNSNWKGSITSLDWVRQAINIGLDRNAIAASSYLGQAEPTVTPYKNGNFQVKLDNLPSFSGETQKAIGILEKNGYNKISSDGYRTNGSRYLNLDILVCTKNQYKLSAAKAVKKSLEELGFKVSITEKAKTKDFNKALSTGHYSLYIGETKLSDNYNLSQFFSESGNLNYGINKDFYNEYKNFKNSKISTMSFVEGLSTEVPIIPLFYRKAVVSVNPNIVGISEKGDIYSSVSDWKLKK